MIDGPAFPRRSGVVRWIACPRSCRNLVPADSVRRWIEAGGSMPEDCAGGSVPAACVFLKISRVWANCLPTVGRSPAFGRNACSRVFGQIGWATARVWANWGPVPSRFSPYHSRYGTNRGVRVVDSRRKPAMTGGLARSEYWTVQVKLFDAVLSDKVAGALARAGLRARRGEIGRKLDRIGRGDAPGKTQQKRTADRCCKSAHLNSPGRNIRAQVTRAGGSGKAAFQPGQGQFC